MKNYRKSSHVIYDIKYHIYWVTKYRYKAIDSKIGTRARDLIRQICSTHDVQIITGAVSSDHIHLFVSCPPKLSVNKLVQYIKGNTSRKLQQEFTELKKRYWGQHLWARGYFVISSGNVTDETWMEYIRNQSEPEPKDDFQVTPT